MYMKKRAAKTRLSIIAYPGLNRNTIENGVLLGKTP